MPFLSCHLSDYIFRLWGRENRNRAARLRGITQDNVCPGAARGEVGKSGKFRNFEFATRASNSTDLIPGTSMSFPGPSCIVLPCLSICRTTSGPIEAVKTDNSPNAPDATPMTTSGQESPPAKLTRCGSFRNFELLHFLLGPVILLT